ncbi:hypothetical protein FA95DRAFT_1534248 [Auriscalpium vulgare]|uniref:Uncharacterized protein n=1 Tax=Auriscalpium vulgare TaxID=40419 RepID=A0ACB8S5T8_9AGAM|nr:hypothetical protein FA95DRAFT_1534248 [Auriscalpium vulgare]
MIALTHFMAVVTALAVSVSSAPTRRITGTQSGQGTFFSPGLGACGISSTDADNIVAVSTQLFNTFPGAGANPNANPICGKTITANSGGKSVTVTVVDECVACALTDLDFSPSAFDALADPSVGRIPITWTLN